jgi:serine palmitoyltransferase
LVDEWTPEALGKELTPAQQADLAAVPVIVGAPDPKPKIQSTGKTVTNLAGYNFAGFAGNEDVKERAVKVLREYGLGSCGPPGFYGTVGQSSRLLLLPISLLIFWKRSSYGART